MGDDGPLARVEENVVGVRSSAQEVDAYKSFLKFVNIFEPNKLVIGEFSENLVGGRHISFFTALSGFRIQMQPLQFGAPAKELPYANRCRFEGTLY